MKVLHVIPGDSAGNSMIFAKRQAADLRLHEVDIEVFYLRSRTQLFGVLRESLRFRQAIKQLKPDLLHAQFGTTTAMMCAAFTRLPLVITYRGSDLNPTPSMPWIRSALGRLLSQLAALRASRIVCVSEQLRDRLWWRRAIATVLPSGVDTEVFRLYSKTDMRAELGWTEEDRVVLFNAGTTPKVKRLDLALASIEEAREAIGPVRLHVLDGTLPQRDVVKLLNAVDCLLLTSDYEGSPTIIQEALACNTPIVSVIVGDIYERLANVVATRICNHDPAEIGAAIALIVADGGRSNGREQIARLDSHCIAAEITKLYTQVTASPRQPEHR